MDPSHPTADSMLRWILLLLDPITSTFQDLESVRQMAVVRGGGVVLSTSRTFFPFLCGALDLALGLILFHLIFIIFFKKKKQINLNLHSIIKRLIIYQTNKC